MKKLYFLAVILIFTSCKGMEYCDSTEWKQQEAQSMYNTFGTLIVEMNASDAQKIFGSCYRQGDDIYVYNTLWSKKYILARYGKAVTYVEDKGQVVGRGAINDKYKNYNRGGEGVLQQNKVYSKDVKWF